MKPEKGGPPQRVGDVLEEVLSQEGYYTICKEYYALKEWPAIAGDALAAVSTCEKIENGILFVKVRSASWRQEAVYLKGALLTKIQKELKIPSIKDIVFL